MKFSGGGGEAANHSSVSPSQGSLPARLPFLDVKALMKKSSTPTAMTPAPIVEVRL